MPHLDAKALETDPEGCAFLWSLLNQEPTRKPVGHSMSTSAQASGRTAPGRKADQVRGGHEREWDGNRG